MKQLLFFTCTLLVLFCACKSKPKNNSMQPEQVESERPSGSFCITDTLLPQTVDLEQDISSYTLQELRLLRSYPYAIHGYHFMEADINAFFTANTKWYTKSVWNIYEKTELEGNGKFPQSYKDIELTKQEKAFVERIDKQIAALRKKQIIKRKNYSLGNADHIVNLFQFKNTDPTFLEKLKQNNFIITKGNNLQLFHAYEENDYRQIPNFITTDLYLQAFHMYFSYVLKSLEKQHFIPIVETLCQGFHQNAMEVAKQATDPKLKETAEFTATFYAIPYYLLTKKQLNIPAKFKEEYEQEIENIYSQTDGFSTFLSYKDAYFPYSLFKPRGHYTREPRLQTYFRAMMWLQTASFCQEQQEQLNRAIFQAALLNNTKTANGTPLKELYQRIYTPLSFLMGEADNLSVMDISQILLREKAGNLTAALTPACVNSVNYSLIALAKNKNKIKPKIKISCPNKINFMPQRYLVDNEILQNLTDVTPNSKRSYPKGLDVFAAFHAASAEKLLNEFYNEPHNWNLYTKELNKLKNKFKTQKNTPTTVYNLWMKSLLTLQQIHPSLPGFMQTPEWNYKNLNTALASWAELKHDAILYGEQPMAAECGGAGPPDPIVVGYVEPNLPFWEKMSEILHTTTQVLEQSKLLNNDLKGKTEQLNDYISFLIQTSQKELKREKLTHEEYRSIEYMGSSIEHFTLSVLDPDLNLDEWSLVQGPDKSIAVVADIYTRNVPGCSKNGILHVATGYANNIYVVVEIEGHLYLTRGATFSYYEFVQPLNQRLNDKEWQQMLENNKAPDIPKWMKSIILNEEPKVNERIFYSSGC